MRHNKGTRTGGLHSADRDGSGSLSSTTGLQRALSIYGLPYACWACGEVGTPLVALADGATRVADDLVVCDTPELLGLADQLLPDDVRRTLRIGRVRLRYTRTSRTTYLANECGACRAVFGQWPLFHEALPEALALDGLSGLVRLAEVAVDVTAWRRAVASRWQ